MHDPTSQSRYATAIYSMYTLLIHIYIHVKAEHSHPPSSLNVFTPSLTITFRCSHDMSIMYAVVALRPRLPQTAVTSISQSNHAPASVGTRPVAKWWGKRGPCPPAKSEYPSPMLTDCKKILACEMSINVYVKMIELNVHVKSNLFTRNDC
jgi:hypothetical protein